MPASERVFWTAGRCTVWVTHTDAGGLNLSGQDLAAFGTPGYEYEYDITVEADQFDALRRGLGVEPRVDVLEAVCAHAADIMATGEHTWLTDHGVVHSLSTRHSPPD